MADAIPGSPEPKEWVLLDRLGRIQYYTDSDAAAAAVANDVTAVAFDTSNNKSGYFTFTLRPPSKVSYLDLHWPHGVPESMLRLPVFAAVLCSDENLVLIRIVLHWMDCASDLFVYTAAPSLAPSARRLPACMEDTRGLACWDRFLTLDHNIGILCRGGDPEDFVVADLVVSWRDSDFPDGCHLTNPPLMIAMLCTFSSKKGEWTVKEMLAPRPHDQDGLSALWYSDRVIPFDGHFLCWVDYYSGVMLCDISDDNSPVLSYASLPGNQHYSDKVRVERDSPETSRNVSVSQGKMRFIHIGDDWRDPCQTSGPTITIWNLMVMGSEYNWVIHRMINLDDLWMQPAYQVWGLPLHPPDFPVATKNDLDVVCCILSENRYLPGKAWIIQIDMKQAGLSSCVQLIDERFFPYEDEVFHRGGQNVFFAAPLLPSNISGYLNKPAGLSWDGDKFATRPAKGSKLSSETATSSTYGVYPVP